MLMKRYREIKQEAAKLKIEADNWDKEFYRLMALIRIERTPELEAKINEGEERLGEIVQEMAALAKEAIEIRNILENKDYIT